jgi:hypothetical protein
MAFGLEIKNASGHTTFMENDESLGFSGYQQLYFGGTGTQTAYSDRPFSHVIVIPRGTVRSFSHSNTTTSVTVSLEKIGAITVEVFFIR